MACGRDSGRISRCLALAGYVQDHHTSGSAADVPFSIAIVSSENGWGEFDPARLMCWPSDHWRQISAHFWKISLSFGSYYDSDWPALITAFPQLSTSPYELLQLTYRGYIPEWTLLVAHLAAVGLVLYLHPACGRRQNEDPTIDTSSPN